MTLARILLTGFEPFGRHGCNPSGEAARILGRERSLRGGGIATATLPVERRQAARRLRDLLARHRPETLVLTGLAATRPHLSLERVAVNLYRPAGDRGAGRTILAGGPRTLPSTLPWRPSLAALGRGGVPVKPSDDAGRYTCNLALYLALAWSAAGRLPDGGTAPRRVGFVHLPPTPRVRHASVAAVPLPDLVASLRALLESLAGS